MLSWDFFSYLFEFMIFMPWNNSHNYCSEFQSWEGENIKEAYACYRFGIWIVYILKMVRYMFFNDFELETFPFTWATLPKGN